MFVWLFYPIIWVDIVYYIVILAILLLIISLSLRRFRFYETHIEITFIFRFLKKAERILYNNIDKVTYKYGQFGGMPVIIIHTRESKKIKQIYIFFIYRFVLGNTRKVVKLFKFLNKKEVSTMILSDSNSKQKIISRIRSS